MRFVIQRVTHADVKVDGETIDAGCYKEYKEKTLRGFETPED